MVLTPWIYPPDLHCQETSWFFLQKMIAHFNDLMVQGMITWNWWWSMVQWETHGAVNGAVVQGTYTLVLYPRIFIVEKSPNFSCKQWCNYPWHHGAGNNHVMVVVELVAGWWWWWWTIKGRREWRRRWRCIDPQLTLLTLITSSFSRIFQPLYK